MREGERAGVNTGERAGRYGVQVYGRACVVRLDGERVVVWAWLTVSLSSSSSSSLPMSPSFPGRPLPHHGVVNGPT